MEEEKKKMGVWEKFLWIFLILIIIFFIGKSIYNNNTEKMCKNAFLQIYSETSTTYVSGCKWYPKELKCSCYLKDCERVPIDLKLYTCKDVEFVFWNVKNNTKKIIPTIPPLIDIDVKKNP